MTWQDYPIKKKKFRGYNLYFRGNLDENLLKSSLAVVGSRAMTHYGKTVTEKFVSQLSANNVTIISGFMYGVDAEAHRICVETGGKTIAVFGCGLDVCFPAENSDLYTQILATGGAVISEYEPKAKPHLWKFPQRNRIVAGLASLGVLVIEAGEKSGSLITAKLAIKAKKPVYAVCGPITSSVSIGTNELIKSGKAKLVTEANDIIHVILSKGSIRLPSVAQDDKGEQQILDLLTREPLSIDDLARKLKKDVIEVSTTVSMMSLKGLVKEETGKFYIFS